MQSNMIKEAIQIVAKKEDMTEAQTREVFEEIMSGKILPHDIEKLLVGLRDKGETVDEICGAAKVMREKALRIDAGSGVILDTCGTGGSGINTFNISTAAAFVIAACGIKVAKHGNRSASSHCGSADVLEALGVDIDLPPEAVARCIKDIGIGFLFAPKFHLAMKYAAGPRKAVGGKTIFNLLGPLSNPAGATHQVMGVCDPKLTQVMAGVLKNLGSKRAIVVCGSDSLDEITITGKTRITQLNNGAIDTFDISPEDFGVKRAALDDIKGGGAGDNAQIFLSIFNGEKSPRRDIVLMNAGAGLVCAGIAENFKKGVSLAAEAVDSKRALDKLNKLISASGKA